MPTTTGTSPTTTPRRTNRRGVPPSSHRHPQRPNRRHLQRRATQAGALDGLRCRHSEAETLNSLGRLASQTAHIRLARSHHSQALAIARDTGLPVEEARALEGLGWAHLHDGNPAEAAAHLKQALTIYQRIGAPGAKRIEETLRHHRMTPQPGS